MSYYDDMMREIERRILFPQAGETLSRFEVLEKQTRGAATTAGAPTAAELEHYFKYVVFLIQTDERVGLDSYILNSDSTAVICHPMNEAELKETLERIQKNHKLRDFKITEWTEKRKPHETSQ